MSEGDIAIRAALGDTSAHSAMAARHWGNATAGTEPLLCALAVACAFAKLADVNGGRDERVQLMFLLDQYALALRDAGFEDAADMELGWCLALADTMADQGDEEIGALLAEAGEAMTPGAVQFAKFLREPQVH